MGCHQSFTQSRWFTTKEWTEICSKIKDIISTSDIKLCGPKGIESSQPIINDHEISFNMYNSKYNDADDAYYAPTKFIITKNIIKNGSHSIIIYDQDSPYDNIITYILNVINEIAPKALNVRKSNSIKVIYKLTS